MSSVRALRASLIVLSLWLPGVDCLTDKASHLVASSPAPNATGVLPSAWLELEFDIDVDAALEASLSIGCDGAGTVPFTSHRVGVRGLVVNPEPRLPAGTRCALRWYVGAVIDGFAFETALGEPAAEVLYDPEDPARTAPYPDDMLLVEDASRATGFRHAMALPDRPMDVRNLFRALLNDANQLDGFSPIGPWVVGLDRPADAASLPATAAESLEPLASLLMVDVDPASPRFGERIPFIVQARDDLTLPSAAPAQPGRTLIVFPSIPLEPMGR